MGINAGACVALAGVLFLGASASVAPDGMSLFGWRVPVTCLYRHVRGRPCPGCGMTRAVTMALQGRWAESARTHPGGIPTAAYLAGQLLLRAALLWLRPASRRVRTWDLALSLAGLFLAACLPALV